MNINILDDLVIENFHQLNFEQHYEPAKLLSFAKRKDNSIDKKLWVSIMEYLHNTLSDYIFIADVVHLYSVSNYDFFPIEKSRIVYLENKHNSTYLFSINKLTELKEITELYCEDYTLTFFILNKTTFTYDEFLLNNFLNFNAKKDDEKIKFISLTDMMITFGANAETMSILYQESLTETIIKPLIAKYQEQ